MLLEKWGRTVVRVAAFREPESRGAGRQVLRDVPRPQRSTQPQQGPSRKSSQKQRTSEPCLEGGCGRQGTVCQIEGTALTLSTCSFSPAFPQAWHRVRGDPIPEQKAPWLTHRDLNFSHVLVPAIGLSIPEKTMSREGFVLARVRPYLGCLTFSLHLSLALWASLCVPICPHTLSLFLIAPLLGPSDPRPLCCGWVGDQPFL